MAETGADERAHLVALSMAAGVGPIRLGRLLRAFGSASAAWQADQGALRQAGLEPSVTAALHRHRQQCEPAMLAQRLAGGGVRALVAGDAEFPARLVELPGMPLVLFIRGQLRPEDAQAVAVVGTRRAGSYGREVTTRLVSELAAAGLTIVSGFARGIDAAAHRACLAAGGRTLAVLGCGVDVPYPAEHRQLAAQVADRGALISEYGPGMPPEAQHFPARNRLIAALSLGVVVIEAGARSGALITASFAADQGREVFAVPGSILSGLSDGCHALIRDGATLVGSAADVLEGLALTRPAERDGRPATRPLPLGDDPVEQAIIQHLSREPTHIDAIQRSSGLTVATLNAGLTLLELKGVVRQPVPKHFALG